MPLGIRTKPRAYHWLLGIAKIPLIKNLFKYITPKFVARSSIENVYADKSKVTDELTDRYFELDPSTWKPDRLL